MDVTSAPLDRGCEPLPQHNNFPGTFVVLTGIWPERECELA